MSLIWKNFTIRADQQSVNPDFKALVAEHLNVAEKNLIRVDVLKKSLDARRKSKIMYQYQLAIDAHDEGLLTQKYTFLEDYTPKVTHSPVAGYTKRTTRPRHRPLVIGSGPAGTFTALCLQEAGIPCQIIERGEAVPKRIRTTNKLRSRGIFDPESNFCFGEGGAGTFSDGKLTCGRNHPYIRHIFKTLIDFGGPESLAYDAHPHIGTDYLLRVAINMRKHLEDNDCSYGFGKIFKGFKDGGKNARYIVSLSDGEEIATDHVILATGHSARDTYQWLYDKGVAMAQKPFAVGARIEHPQEQIDEIQYGQCHFLPAAEYKLAARSEQRGIWTFCMCPGGQLLPTGAQAGHLAINGMSYHKRKSGFANAAVVVNVLREDFDRGHPLDGMHFQAQLEKEAFRSGGGNYHCPAQKLQDFASGRMSKNLSQSTYKPGLESARLDKILPDFISSALQSALKAYDQKMRGYLSADAMIVGLESKTSAPVTLLRGKDLQSISHPGVYPCGEGAGFAGGIVSAALDGLKVGKAVADQIVADSSLRIVH